VSSTFLVLGATGKTGRRVAQRLTARGYRVRAGSRSSATRFDWTNRTTWPAALDGVDAVYLSYQPDLIARGAPDDIAVFTRMARDAGVSRLVLLSGRGEPEAAACAQIVRDSGIPATILVCSWFAQNFSEDFLADGVVAGGVVVPVETVAEPFVDVDDIADVAVAALTEDRHAGRTYELTGPRLLTFAEATAAIADALGRDIAFVPVTPDDYRAAIMAAQLPQEYVDLVTTLFGTLFDGRNASVVHGVVDVLGRPPRDFTEFAKNAVAQGRWRPVDSYRQVREGYLTESSRVGGPGLGAP
jgi:uncharacterized protein YbjT (DUF2867 family)